MSLKDHNLGPAQVPIPKAWDSEKHFMKYEYGPLQGAGPSLPQEPTPMRPGQPLKGVSLGTEAMTAAEKRDSRVANARRRARAGSSLDEIGKKYGL
jgi:hypothetical protein